MPSRRPPRKPICSTRSARFTRVAGITATVVLALAGCGGADDQELQYQTDYFNHEHLKVVGYPTVNTLRLTQTYLWALADGNADTIAGLAAELPEGQAARAADNLIRAFRLGANGEVTGDFYDGGDDHATVFLYFKDTKQVTALHMRFQGIGGADGLKLDLAGAVTPEGAAARPSAAPASPGAQGSGSMAG